MFVLKMLAYVLFCFLLVKTIDCRAIEAYGYKPMGHDGLEHHLDMNTDGNAWKTRIYTDDQNIASIARPVPERAVMTASSDVKSSEDTAVVIGDRDGITGNQQHPCPVGYIKLGKFCIEETSDDYP